MSMREKIARAIDPSVFKFWQASYDYEMRQSGDAAEAKAFADWAHSKNTALDQADAVLDALMEPTEGMVAHAEALSDFMLSEALDNTPEGRRAEFRGAFISAIRAAKEGE